MPIDYRELLMKYISHVGHCEGVTFILNEWRRPESPFITAKEWEELELLDDESRKWTDEAIKS